MLKWIPDLTKYRYTEAKRDCFLLVRGALVKSDPKRELERELERNTLLDKPQLTYAEALEGQTAGVPQLETCTMPVSAHNDSDMKMGWALKTSGSKVRFTSTRRRDWAKS